MNNDMSSTQNEPVHHVTSDSSDRVQDDTYDRGIVPAETAARREREGELYKTHPTEAREAAAPTDDQTDGGSVHSTDGYTVDKEGLLNNYAVEPEMYYETPGDATAQAKAEAAERAEELDEVNEESGGKLSDEQDVRAKGPGII